MQNSTDNKTEEFINAYRSFNKCKKSEVFNYYSKCNHSSKPTFLVILIGVLFLLGVISFVGVGKLVNDTNESNGTNLSMSRDERVQSARVSLSRTNMTSINSNDYESTPKIDLASFEF